MLNYKLLSLPLLLVSMIAANISATANDAIFQVVDMPEEDNEFFNPTIDEQLENSDMVFFDDYQEKLKQVRSDTYVVEDMNNTKTTYSNLGMTSSNITIAPSTTIQQNQVTNIGAFNAATKNQSDDVIVLDSSVKVEPDTSLEIFTSHPLPGAKITSQFGYRRLFGRTRMHKGIDLSKKRGSPIKAAGAGEVTFAGYKSGYGRSIIIKHADNYETRYAHADRLHVKKGEMVDSGQHIANMGCTGRCTGPHLHFEIRSHGIAVDPLGYIYNLK